MAIAITPLGPTPFFSDTPLTRTNDALAVNAQPGVTSANAIDTRNERARIAREEAQQQFEENQQLARERAQALREEQAQQIRENAAETARLQQQQLQQQRIADYIEAQQTDDLNPDNPLSGDFIARQRLQLDGNQQAFTQPDLGLVTPRLANQAISTYQAVQQPSFTDRALVA